MKLKDYLTEIFTTDVPLKIEDYTKQSGQWIAKFSVGDIDYVFNAKIMNQVQDIWELTFWVETREYSFSRYGLTGTGNAAAVMAAVIKAFKIFIKKFSPATFWFEAKEESRQKLYDRLSKYITGYKRVRSGGKFVFKKT